MGVTELQINSAILQQDNVQENITEDIEPEFRIHERLRSYNILIKPKQKQRKSI